MGKAVTLAICVPLALEGLAQPRQPPPFALFTQVGLTPPQIAAIDQGRPVAKVLASVKRTVEQTAPVPAR